MRSGIFHIRIDLFVGSCRLFLFFRNRNLVQGKKREQGRDGFVEDTIVRVWKHREYVAVLLSDRIVYRKKRKS